MIKTKIYPQGEALSFVVKAPVSGILLFLLYTHFSTAISSDVKALFFGYGVLGFTVYLMLCLPRLSEWFNLRYDRYWAMNFGKAYPGIVRAVHEVHIPISEKERRKGPEPVGYVMQITHRDEQKGLDVMWTTPIYQEDVTHMVGERLMIHVGQKGRYTDGVYLNETRTVQILRKLPAVTVRSMILLGIGLAIYQIIQ